MTNASSGYGLEPITWTRREQFEARTEQFHAFLTFAASEAGGRWLG
jgi:hypothetical protein